MSPIKRRIGEMLLDDGLISAGQLSQALESQAKSGGKLVEKLIAHGSLTFDDFVRFLSRQPGIASIDLTNYHIPEDYVSLVPREIVLKHEVFPIDKMGRLLTLGMVCPLDSATIDKISEITGLKVKPILCSPDHIRAAIRRYYSLVPGVPDEPTPSALKARKPKTNKAKNATNNVAKADSGLKLKRVPGLLTNLTSLPALPVTVRKVQEAMGNMSVTLSDVTETILQDPPVAAKVLSVANSAAYGFPNKVSSVDLAVALMGLKETYSIVLSAAIINLFDKGKQTDYAIFWEEALNCAAACRTIANLKGKAAPDGVFTAGLLHDIGRIALLETAPDRYAQIDPQLAGAELTAMEEELVGLTHAEAGFELATNWNLPADIAEAIRLHHQPDLSTEAPTVVAIVALAEAWSRTAAIEGTDKAQALLDSQALLDQIGLDMAQASFAFDEISRQERSHFQWDKANITG